MSTKKMPGPPRRDRLRIEGLRPVATPPPAEPAPVPEPDPTPVRPAPRVRSRATVVLPAPVAEQLREWSRAAGRTHGDLILSSLLAHYRTVAEQVEGSDAEREALGLPPVRPPRPKGPTSQLSVAMSEAGRDRLDTDAKRLGMGRSALVTELLGAALAAAAESGEEG